MASKIQARCPFCGDSEKHTDKGHLTIYLDSLSFYCFRCGTNGEISIKDAMVLLALMPSDGDSIFGGVVQPRLGFKGVTVASTSHSESVSEPPAEWSTKLKPGSRPSEVSRRWQSGGYDIFEIRTRTGVTSGYHLRGLSKKVSYTIGKVELGFNGPKINPRIPWKIVEGPYDVIDKDFICTFGVPTNQQVEALKFLDLTLVPDGDVWNKPALLVRWFKPFFEHSVPITEVWRIPDGRDIDETDRVERISAPLAYTLYRRAKAAVERNDVTGGSAKSRRTLHLSKG